MAGQTKENIYSYIKKFIYLNIIIIYILFDKK